MRRRRDGRDEREEHLKDVIERVAPDVLAYFERRLADREDAADLLGETLLVAWRRVGVVPQQTDQARMWMFGVAKGVLSNHVRGARRRLNLADALREELVRTARDAAQSDGHDGVREAIEELPGDLAELVRLVHWDGFKIVEVAELMGISPSTARSRYARARELLRRSLRADSPPVAQLTRRA